ncbi:hypothetical protein M501DRAFT_1014342 [Patellaria atrata CBS 101060]|uniref:Enhancer of polycomb-like protein n=1 Tax=Patellaria atrata CBS 101060 TaxID=1346257 RepID=A0A9P4VVD4_9PEZI|nr:hypothetical protein M501DRAFT_1014342 [Patellaria atrata CBS 101060]
MPPRPLFKAMKQEIVQVKIGDDGPVFNLHRDVLCSQSKYFRNAFEGEFREKDDGVIRLQDVSVKTFETVMNYVYYGELLKPDSKSRSNNPSHVTGRARSGDKSDSEKVEHAPERQRPRGVDWDPGELVDLFVFGDEYDMRGLRAKVMTVWTEQDAREPFGAIYRTIHAIAVDRAFERLPKNSTLCRYLTDLVAYACTTKAFGNKEDERSLLEQLPSELLVNVVLTISSLSRLDKKFSLPPFEKVGCKYKEFEEEVDQRTNQLKRSAPVPDAPLSPDHKRVVTETDLFSESLLNSARDAKEEFIRTHLGDFTRTAPNFLNPFLTPRNFGPRRSLPGNAIINLRSNTSNDGNLTIVREEDVEAVPDEEAQRHVPKFETGVEKAEEIEHHLQAVIAGRDPKKHIPTPDAVLGNLPYEKYYPKHYQQTATFIRFSSTVEDTTGCPYCMTADDDAFLKCLNRKKSKWGPCSEDQFEEVMNFFEETSQAKQPLAHVDNTPVISYEEMESAFDDSIDDHARRFAKEIYEHWKAERLKRGNRRLTPNLKFETNIETDDSDPYVCFRRREVRQARKTRGRDALVVDKLKKLRIDMENARQVLHFVKQREIGHRDQLALDKDIFQKRIETKEMKRKLGIKDHDEDLINQKPSPKPKPKLDPASLQRGMPGMASKAQLARSDGRAPDSELVSLQEINQKKEEEVQRFINESLIRHQNWNKGWTDLTWRPITPPLESSSKSQFRAADVQYLPTPPASISEEGDAGVRSGTATPKTVGKGNVVTIRYVSPPLDQPSQSRPSYRQRRGRGGRLMIDRRGVKRKAEEANLPLAEGYWYDQDSDEDDEIYHVDPYDTMSLKYRVMLAASRAPIDPTAQNVNARRSLVAPPITSQLGLQSAPQPMPQQRTAV